MKPHSSFKKDCDELAIRSQQTWGEANKNGVFDLEMAPVEIETKKGVKVRTRILDLDINSCPPNNNFKSFVTDYQH